MKTLHNPDTEKIYHVWHYCSVCHKTFKHTQATFDMLANNKEYACCKDNLVNVSTDVNEVSV